MEEACNEIKEDMKKIEEDSKKLTVMLFSI